MVVSQVSSFKICITLALAVFPSNSSTGLFRRRFPRRYVGHLQRKVTILLIKETVYLQLATILRYNEKKPETYLRIINPMRFIFAKSSGSASGLSFPRYVALKSPQAKKTSPGPVGTKSASQLIPLFLLPSSLRPGIQSFRVRA